MSRSVGFSDLLRFLICLGPPILAVYIWGWEYAVIIVLGWAAVVFIGGMVLLGWSMSHRDESMSRRDDGKHQEEELLRDAQLAIDGKGELVEEVKNLSDQELNDFQRFWNYVDYPVGPNADECCGDIIQFASEELRANRELVIKAVKYPNNDWSQWPFHPIGSPLEYASEELRGDREVVLWAVWNSPDAYLFASEELQMDATVYLSAMRAAGEGFYLDFDPTNIPERLFEDSERCYEFLKSIGSDEDIHHVLEDYTPPEGYDTDHFSDDGRYIEPDFWSDGRNHIEAWGEQIKHLFTDKDLLLRALEETEWAVWFIPKALSKDRDIKAISKSQKYGNVWRSR